MNTEKSAYRQIMKATSIFGGVQVFNILISIGRSKAIAILLGPAGIGIAGLLTSSIGLISSLTNFGLGTSAVRDIASAYEAGDEERMARTTAVFRRLVWISGLLGAVITLVASPWLSEFTFGDRTYTWAFIWLSITLLISQLTAGQNVILQGTRKLKYLASANMIGSVLSLIITLPLYYFYGLDGIVPALIIMALATFSVSLFFANKISIPGALINLQTVFTEGRQMLKLGFLLSLSGLIGTLVAYLVRIYISNTGGVEDVGLYSAGFQIIGTYVGLIFTAMATDYYPRLSAIANEEHKVIETINQQAEIAILILGPILIIFIVFIKWIVIILYSQMFVSINEMMIWAAFGMFFKAASWPIGFLFLAKGASKIFFWSEFIASLYMLLFNVIGYKYFGLEGLGISFLVSYFLVYFQVFLIAKIKYQFKYNFEFYKLFIIQLFIFLLPFFILLFNLKDNIYILGILFITISTVHSVVGLNKRLEIFKLKSN